jgi:transposase
LGLKSEGGFPRTSALPYEQGAPRKWPRRGRPTKVGPGYAERWKVEWAFAWLGNFRRLLMRYERYPSTFRAFCLIALVLMSLKRVP